MGFAIPKLQYKNLDTTGDTTISSGTIANIPDVSEIEVGMYVRGTGIPAGATVGSIGATSITLASGVLATANGAAVAVLFGYEILFDFPPVEATGNQYETKGTITQSLSGVKQVSVDHIELVRKFTFSFLSQALYTAMDTFLTTFALLGGEFRYFDDKTIDSYVVYDLNTLKTAPKKVAPKGQDTYVWDLPLDFRKVP